MNKYQYLLKKKKKCTFYLHSSKKSSTFAADFNIS